jgi:hypothetical protein
MHTNNIKPLHKYGPLQVSTFSLSSILFSQGSVYLQITDSSVGELVF